MAGLENEILDDDLSMDMIQLEGFKLPSDLEIQTDDEGVEKSTIEQVTDDESQESVGNDIKSSEAGKDIEKSPAGSDDNVFKTFATFLAERGLLNIKDTDIETVQDDDAFAELMRDQIRQNELSDLNDNQRKYLEALRIGIPDEVIHDHLVASKAYEELTDEVIRSNQGVRKDLIIEGFKAQGFDENYALKQYQRVSDSNDDVEEAIMFRDKLKQLQDQTYEATINQKKQAEENEQKNILQQAEDLKKAVYSTEKLFNDYAVTKTMQDKVHHLMTKAVVTLDNGIPVNALQKHQLENPIEFQKNLYFVYLLTNGFEDMNALVNRASTKAVNSFKAKLQKTNFIGTSQSNPTFNDETVPPPPIITDIIDE